MILPVLYDDLYEEILSKIKGIFDQARNSQVFEYLKFKLLEQKRAERAEQEKEEIFKELSYVKKNIADMRKVLDKSNLSFTSDLSALNTLIGKQRSLTQRLALIECGETNYDIDNGEIEEQLNKFFDVQVLDEKLVSRLIQKIEVGETLVTEEGPKRNITITYAFEKIG